MTLPKVSRGIEPRLLRFIKTMNLAAEDDAGGYFDGAPEEVALELTELDQVRKFKGRYIVAAELGAYVLNPGHLGFVERRFLMWDVGPVLEFLLALPEEPVAATPS